MRQLFNHFPWTEREFNTPDCERVMAQEAGNTAVQAIMWEDEQGFGVEIKGLVKGLVYGVGEEPTLKAAEDHIREGLSDLAVMMRAAKVSVTI